RRRRIAVLVLRRHGVVDRGEVSLAPDLVVVALHHLLLRVRVHRGVLSPTPIVGEERVVRAPDRHHGPFGPSRTSRWGTPGTGLLAVDPHERDPAGHDADLHRG